MDARDEVSLGGVAAHWLKSGYWSRTQASLQTGGQILELRTTSIIFVPISLSESQTATAAMNSAQAAVENIDLEKLNDQDKAELRQFLGNQQQRSQIQSRG